MNGNFSEGGNDNATDVTGALQSKRCGGSNVGAAGCTEVLASWIRIQMPQIGSSAAAGDAPPASFAAVSDTGADAACGRLSR